MAVTAITDRQLGEIAGTPEWGEIRTARRGMRKIDEQALYATGLKALKIQRDEEAAYRRNQYGPEKRRPLSVLTLEPEDLRSLLFGKDVPAVNRWAYEALVAQVEGKSAVRSPEWLGSGEVRVKSMDDILRLARDGWAPGAQRALNLSDQIKRDLPAPKSRKRRTHWSDQGDELDRDRQLMGNFDTAWRTTKRLVRSGLQTVTIVAPWGVPGSWDQEQLYWTGAAMIVLADILDDAGFQLELVAASPTVMAAGDVLSVCQLKHPGDPLRADLIAALFCHAGVSRCFDFFAMLYADFQINRDFGAAGEVGKAWEVARKEGMVEPATIILERVRNESDCVRIAKATLAAIIKADESGIPREDDDPPIQLDFKAELVGY